MLHFYTQELAVSFDGTGDALDLINTIESRTRMGNTNYQRILIIDLSVQTVV